MIQEQITIHYRSFLVRLWQENEAESSIEWRGELESIQTGRAWQFEGLEPLLALLATQLPAKSPSSHSLEESS